IGLSSQGQYQVHSLDGALVKTLTTVGTVTDEHELQPLPNGDYLMDSYVPRDGVDLSAYGGPSNATVLDAEMQEVSPDGKLVWSWNSRDHISLAESADWYGGGVLASPAHLPD